MPRQGQNLRPVEHLAGIAPGHPLHRRVGEQPQPVQTAIMQTGHELVDGQTQQSPSPIHPGYVSPSRGAVRLEYGAPVELAPMGGEQIAPGGDAADEL